MVVFICRLKGCKDLVGVYNKIRAGDMYNYIFILFIHLQESVHEIYTPPIYTAI